VDPLDAAEGRSRPPASTAAEDPSSRALEDLRARARALGEEARRAWEAEGAGGEPPALERALVPVDRDLARALEAHRAWREARQGRGRARYERALGVLRPKGQPQERVLCALSLVARHGIAAIRAGLEALAPGAPHRIVPLA
jgi:hypothetical protein